MQKNCIGSVGVLFFRIMLAEERDGREKRCLHNVREGLARFSIAQVRMFGIVGLSFSETGGRVPRVRQKDGFLPEPYLKYRR